MVPEKLQLRNFMCYGEDVPPLEFAGIHVACLSGQNGAGKSTLLDALTWALWGKARAKSDDDLIKLGHDEMQVVLDFLLDDQRYRVLRSRKRGKKSGMTTLDFQICDSDTTWRRLTGNTVTETQDEINRVLRIEYETFINSAFLLQGRADEFTSRRPAERKQVLADILGLTEYEELERRAKDEANRLSKDLDELRHFLDHLQQQADQQPILEQLLAEAHDRVAVIEEDLNDHESGLHELREQATRLEVVSRERVTLVQSIAEAEAEQHELARLSATLQANVQQFEAVIARQAEIEAGCAQLQTTQVTLVEMDQRRERYDQLISDYRDWDDRLKAMRHALELEQQSAAEQVARLEQQRNRRESVQSEQAKLAQQLADVSAVQADLARRRVDESRLTEQQTRLLELQVQATKLQGQINVQRDSLVGVQQEQQRRINELTATVALIPDLERQSRELRSELLHFQTLEDELATRREEVSGAMARLGALQAEYKAVEAEGKEIKGKLQIVAQGDATCPVCDSALGADGLARLTEQYEAQRDTLRERIKEVRRDQQAVESGLESQQAAIGELEQRLATRPGIDARKAQVEYQLAQAGDAQAKLREATETLHVVDAQLMQRDYAQAEQQQLGDVQAQLAALGDLAATKQALGDVRADIAALEQQFTRSERIQQQVARIEADLALIVNAEREYPAAAARYAAISAQINDESYGIVERQQRDAVQAAGQALGYRKDEHVALRETLAGLKHWEREALELDRALASIEAERGHVRRNQDQQARYERELALKRQQIAALEQQLQDKPTVDQALRTAEFRSRQLRTQLDGAQSERAIAQERLQICEKNIQLLAEQRARATGLTEERAVFEELTQAFGKKGIQAMLIETAIPELEHEANELLGRMTDNQFHLAFETQRDTRKGDNTIETLDIRISDGLGTRDYQMFSGGEAFRVNFAVRIALSKLLARRAGANLKTLIIDEGFGSQDGTGRDRLVEAINSIQSEFERILVITHIQELKDMFQAQIEITKTPEGSMWAIT